MGSSWGCYRVVRQIGKLVWAKRMSTKTNKCNHTERIEMKKMRTALVGLSIVMSMVMAIECRAETNKRMSPYGIAFLEDSQYPAVDMSVKGMRLCVIYGENADVWGLDIGIFGCRVNGNLFGLELAGVISSVGLSSGSVQMGGIASICEEDFCGCQISGIANSTGQAVYGGQVSIFNMAQSIYGTQIGVINRCERAQGVQIGVVNFAEKANRGLVQLGLVNVIQSNARPVIPIINVGF